jgi:hypothetical protein
MLAPTARKEALGRILVVPPVFRQAPLIVAVEVTRLQLIPFAFSFSQSLVTSTAAIFEA